MLKMSQYIKYLARLLESIKLNVLTADKLQGVRSQQSRVVDLLIEHIDKLVDTMRPLYQSTQQVNTEDE